MNLSKTHKITFWNIIGALIIVVGVYSTFLRFTSGLKSVTNLTDEFPWGLWIGFDILCGVGLAAGGFTICALTHVFNIEKFKPLARPAILTAFLGYLLVIFGLMYDLGKPYNIWHALIMWNPRSVMFEVAWCVMLYTTVLFFEFSPIMLEKLKMNKTLKMIKVLSIPIMIAGIILSTLHQSSLGSLYLIVPTKMHPLWYSSLLPIYFYLSAISVGLAMVIFESYLSARAFNKGLEIHLLSKIGFYSSIVLIVYFVTKIVELFVTSKINFLQKFNEASFLYFTEITIGIVIPALILLKKELRESRKWLYISSVLIIAGFLLNRLNVSITALSTAQNISYFPSFYEINITLMLIVIGLFVFKIVAKNFPLFTEENKNFVKN